jgi:NAD(P)-dependent dehydrogenase (short-subunit alcohol dehydrogenase family)
MDELFRPGLLDGRTIVVAGEAPEVRERLTALGAAVASIDPGGDEGAASAAVSDVLERSARINGLVLDMPGRRARDILDRAWILTRAVATAAMIPGERGGAIVLLTPPPDAAQGEATRAGLENMARTLSVEWARFGIRPTAIAPGATTAAAEVAALVAYLLSPAGDYFSGSRLSLGESAPAGTFQ